MTPEEKRERWKQIQKRDPKLAEFLKQIRTHFGKPERVTFKLNQQEK